MASEKGTCRNVSLMFGATLSLEEFADFEVIVERLILAS